MLGHWAGGGQPTGWRRSHSSGSPAGEASRSTDTPSLPTAATTGIVWRLGPHTCASVQRATEGLCVTTRMTLPTPALPSSVTTGSATSQIEGSPIAGVSPALVGTIANKVGVQGATRRPCDPPPLPGDPGGPSHLTRTGAPDIVAL